MPATEDALLEGMAANPAEVERWLVLADWLEDEQDPRAELARLRYHLHAEADHADHVDRATRQQTLIAAGLSPVVPTWSNSLGMRFALVHPGSFWMGTSEGSSHELRHRVTLTQPYFLGVYPVTVGEFRRFTTATNYQTLAEQGSGGWGYQGTNWLQDPATNWLNPGFKQHAKHPVTCLCWNDAAAFVAWLNQVEANTGRVYSLPTEAQWEYACRAGTDTTFFWGRDETPITEWGWFEPNAKRRTHAVDTKKANPWGLHHMHGMMWEWCADWYEAYTADPVRDPRGAETGTSRILRGGSWGREPLSSRSGSRRYDDPTLRLTTFGVRVAVTLGA